MRCLLILGALVGLIGVSIASAQQIEVDAREVIRRGDMVEHVTDERADVDPLNNAFGQVTALPQNDVDKWFLYVIGRKNCPACDTLKKQWESDPILRAYAIPDNPKESWAHYTFYDYNDPLQNWRWTKSPSNPNAIEIKAFPTIIVQPPRSGIYGNPSTVVFQYVYEGDPQTFKEKVNAAIKHYLAVLQQRNALPAGRAQEVTTIGGGGFRSLETDTPALDQATLQALGDAMNRIDPPPASGFGQQTIPPLDLPNEPKEPTPSPTPLRDGLNALMHTPEIIVVRDPQQRRSDDVEAAIDNKIKELQPENGEAYNVKEIPVDKNPYMVVPSEAPAVLLVRGKQVSEKLAARVEEEKGFLSLMLIPLAMSLFGGYSTAHIIAGVFKLVITLVLIFMAFAVLVILVSRAQAAQHPAPSPTPPAPDNSAELAELRAKVAALQPPSAAARPKPAPAGE
jgi:hypothetical protein